MNDATEESKNNFSVQTFKELSKNWGEKESYAQNISYSKN